MYQQPQYVQQPQYGQPPQYVQQPQYGQQPVAAVANPVYQCPAGGSHIFTDEFTPVGICLGICFFPAGLLCTYAMREQCCRKCGLTQ